MPQSIDFYQVLHELQFDEGGLGHRAGGDGLGSHGTQPALLATASEEGGAGVRVENSMKMQEEKKNLV